MQTSSKASTAHQANSGRVYSGCDGSECAVVRVAWMLEREEHRTSVVGMGVALLAVGC
jgi:hypothetical protein